VNEYRGGVYQQALSHLAYVTDDVFVKGGGNFGVYGMSPESLSARGSIGFQLSNRKLTSKDSNSLPTPIIEMKGTLPG
jgi:hypothetical protein